MSRLFYVGCYAASDEPGVFTCELNEETGDLRVLSEVSGVIDPTYVAKHPFLPVLYSVGSDEEGGLIASYSIAEDGSLTLRNTAHIESVEGCHVSVNETGDYIAAANYGNASLSILHLTEDGLVMEETDHVHHEGSSVHPLRQTAAHIHFAAYEGDDIISCDLGEDRIYRYHLDKETGKIREAGTQYEAIPGDGPRHVVLNRKAGKIYGIMEMGANVTTYDEADGTRLQRIPTIPDDVDLKSLPLLDYDAYGAAIRSTEDGTRVLASNRGHNSITVFSVGEDGLLTLESNAPTDGIAPRDFNIAGSYVVAAHQASSDLTVLKFNEERTALTLTGTKLALPSRPVCVLFV